KASFVLFMRNLIEQARAHRAHGMTGPARAGEPMRVTLPASATKVEIETPNGEKSEVPVRGGLAVVPDIQRVGFYHLAWQGPQAGSAVVPANLTSEAESDLTPKDLSADVAESGKVRVESANARPDAHNEWTWVLALAALAWIVFDIWYVTRDAKPTPLPEVTPPPPPQRAAPKAAA